MKQITDKIRSIAKEGLKLPEKSEKEPIGNFIIDWKDWYSRALKALELAFGTDSELYRDFRDSDVKPQVLAKTSRESELRRTITSHLGSQLGMIMGAVSILDEDWLPKVQDEATKKAMGSFEDLASDLLDDGYKDAAAVLSRVILEEKLHIFCSKANMLPKKKKPGINDYTNELYNRKKLKKHEMRAIQRWADIGNDAIHLRFDQYSKKDVKQMITWISDFE